MAAWWVKEEEKASEHRQREREAEEADKLEVVVGDISIIFPCSFAVGITQQYGIYVLLG